MKKAIYILATAAFVMVLSSCQKDEFEEIMIQRSAETEAGAYGGQDEVFEQDDLEERALPIRIKKTKTGVVKEVSDGDEESDDDDTSS